MVSRFHLLFQFQLSGGSVPYFLMRHSRVIRRVCPHYPPNEPNYDQLAAIHVLVSYKHRGKHDTARAEQSVRDAAAAIALSC